MSTYLDVAAAEARADEQAEAELRWETYGRCYDCKYYVKNPYEPHSVYGWCTAYDMYVYESDRVHNCIEAQAKE